MFATTDHHSSAPDPGTAVLPQPHVPRLIAASVDEYPEGQDAAALGAALARATGAELMLVLVHDDPLVVLPTGMNWTSLHEQARNVLSATRIARAPDARVGVETDLSVARALQRVVRREHRDVLVVGSSRHAPQGRVRIGKRTRQLLCHFDCALAIAPRGIHRRRDIAFRRIGVGYDGSPEAHAALAFAAGLAEASGADLHVRGVVDDRMLASARGRVWLGDMIDEWQQMIQIERHKLRQQALEAGVRLGVSVEAHTAAGRPADELLRLSEEVDMLVIGSRRWGPAARVLLGSTGEALLHDAACPVMTVPRPDEPSDRGQAAG